MKKIEINRMEVLQGGHWTTWAGYTCAVGVGILATGTSVFTGGVTAFLGTIGIHACLAGIAYNTKF